MTEERLKYIEFGSKKFGEVTEDDVRLLIAEIRGLQTNINPILQRDMLMQMKLIETLNKENQTLRNKESELRIELGARHQEVKTLRELLNECTREVESRSLCERIDAALGKK